MKAKIVWDKGPAFGAGDLAFPWKPSFEECWFSPGPWKSDHRGEGVWRGPCVVSWQSVAGGRLHPHQKPVWLFERIINALPTCDRIIDPCMGVGSTGMACLKSGKYFVGCELDENYFGLAAKRLAKEAEEPMLFRMAREFEQSSLDF
jgi:DNA modification methylase